MNDVEMNSGLSLDSDRQVEHPIIAYFEKPKALIELKELFREESDIHSAVCGHLERTETLGFQLRTSLTINCG
jgi:hypothetical protein